MPEGPSIVILKEQVQLFKGKKVLNAGGNNKAIDKDRLIGHTVVDFKSFGKQFLICFKTFTVRIHLLMFGTYRINEEKDAKPRLSMTFKNGTLNFYTCSVKVIEEPLDEVFDWSGDIMADEWDAKKALKKLQAKPDTLICDALLDQDIFAGLGNIIKNEVLFRVRIHPESRVGAIPVKELKLLIKEVRHYAFQFLEWKKEYKLKEHWLAHTKKICPRDNVPFHKAHLGKTHRRTFYCDLCQELYA
ncbi:MAG: Endonuclease-8 [Flavipsychrobacter sp.]|nr:Endonuclease-8 [Flavipsychrobacter sp.]